jgi:hypothetical protein
VNLINQGPEGTEDLIAYSEEAVLGSMWSALHEYLHRTEENLQKAEKEFSDWAHKELEKVPSVQHGNFWEQLAEEYSYHHEEFPRVLHNSIFVSACSVLEYWMRVICSGLKEKQHSPIGWNDLRGGTTKKWKLYFQLAHLDIPVAMTGIWEEVEHYYEVRNCIVHEQGLLEEHPNNQRLINFLTSKGITLEDNDEKEITLTTKFCEEAIKIMEAFSDKMYRTYRQQEEKHNSDK